MLSLMLLMIVLDPVGVLNNGGRVSFGDAKRIGTLSVGLG